MPTTSIELYNALIQAGVDKEKAKKVARNLVTRHDTLNFATKTDINQFEVMLYKAMAVQTITVIAAVVGL